MSWLTSQISVKLEIEYELNVGEYELRKRGAPGSVQNTDLNMSSPPTRTRSLRMEIGQTRWTNRAASRVRLSPEDETRTREGDNSTEI
ncbi:hypothetical protein EVAR_61966_1 [Eumeta japonica]|uniref:Uncharacterized protein n=1 Tax=Eumeta variegata TaxID=151549 RepID=A0A4C1T7M3_EUMVA|nr:hypothetical protein EVAR_61966_1 [Eumeta japonica]